MNQAPSMLKPALISGAAFGVAGAIPVINWLNCACCALIIGAGSSAHFSTPGNAAAPAPFRPRERSDCRSVFRTGLRRGFRSVRRSHHAAFGMGDWQQAMERIQASGADIDPEVLDQISAFMESSGPS